MYYIYYIINYYILYHIIEKNKKFVKEILTESLCLRLNSDYSLYTLKNQI